MDAALRQIKIAQFLTPLLSVDEVVRPSEHKSRDEAYDREADYAIENSPKADRRGGPDRIEIEAMHECAEKIDRPIGCEYKGKRAQDAAQHIVARHAECVSEPGLLEACDDIGSDGGLCHGASMLAASHQATSAC
jgi:hypothetical protein